MAFSMTSVANATAFASRRGDAMGARVRARAPTARTVAPRRVAPLRVVAEDFPKPDKIDKTDNYREGAALSQKFKVRPLTPPPPARAPPHDSIDPSVPSSPPYHVKIRLVPIPRPRLTLRPPPPRDFLVPVPSGPQRPR